MNDDDVLRRALHGPTEPISSYRVLQDLRIPMRRARHRRRVAVGATAALLLVGGGAGVLAMRSAPGSATTPTTSSDNNEGAAAPTLPPLNEPDDMTDTDTRELQATTTAPAPVAPTAPPTPAGPMPQVLTSACGDVVVEFDERTVRIASIAPLPGYTSRVSTDGPESVEMKFVGTDAGCEVHAELKASGLDVEIQNSDHDD